MKLATLREREEEESLGLYRRIKRIGMEEKEGEERKKKRAGKGVKGKR